MAETWPLVGREAETDQIMKLVRDPAARGVVIVGPAGVGKTRLGEECVGRAKLPTVAVRATRSAATIPLGAFGPFLPGGDASGPADHMSLRRATEALAESFDGARGVIFVDDAHALDDASAALLLHVARSNLAFVLVTIRTGEAAPDALRGLWKDELPRIDLASLDRAALDALLPAILGAPVDGATSHALHEASQGNPLYLRELVAGLVDDGTLADESGMWRLRGVVSAPPRLAELITERLEGLSGRERFVLQTVALSEPLGIRIVEQLGWGAEWDSLERRGLVVVHRSERRQYLRVSHPMYGDVVRADVSTRRRNAILKGSAESVTRMGLRRRDDARRVAVWQLEAGEVADPDVLLTAARVARAAGDHGGTELFARAALAIKPSVNAAHLLGRSLDDNGRHDAAEDVLRDAQPIAVTDEEQTLLALARSENLFRGLTRVAEAGAVLETALAAIRDESWREELIAQQAMFALFEGDVAQTLALSDPLLERPEDPAYCRGALQAAMIRVLAGRLDEAVAIATHAYEVRVGLGDQMHLADPGVYFVALILAWEQAGNLEQAITTARAAYGVAAAEQLRNGMAWLCIALSRAELASGRVRTAERFAREAAVLFGELEHPGARWGYGLVALSAGQAGAADVADEAIADLDAEPDTPLQLMETEIDRARAWAAAARGDLPRARAALLAAADRAHARELYALEAAALHDLTRIGAAAADRLVAIADRVDGPLMAARVRCAIAHRDADTAALEEAAREFDALGARLDAAETWNEAAIVHRRDGNARAAAAAALEAKTAAAACEGARTPSLAHGTDAAVLTRREREVATLASHGLASREIAEALVVSARTVENHLQRAYEKLGVTGRTELADALARAGY